MFVPSGWIYLISCSTIIVLSASNTISCSTIIIVLTILFLVLSACNHTTNRSQCWPVQLPFIRYVALVMIETDMIGPVDISTVAYDSRFGTLALPPPKDQNIYHIIQKISAKILPIATWACLCNKWGGICLISIVTLWKLKTREICFIIKNKMWIFGKLANFQPWLTFHHPHQPVRPITFICIIIIAAITVVRIQLHLYQFHGFCIASSWFSCFLRLTSCVSMMN